MRLYEYVFKLQDKVSGTMKKITAAQDKASSKFDKLRNKAGQFGQKLRAAAGEIPGFDAALNMISNPFILLTAGALALGAAFGSITSKAAAFNEEFVNLKNLNLDKTEQQLGQLNDKILKLSIAEGLDPNETTKAFYDIQSATGLYGQEVEDLTRTIGRYSIATGANMGDAINSTTKAMKAFGLASSEVEGLLVSNAKTVQVGITNFDELAKVQTEYAGAASAAGQSVDTSNKLFAAFTAVAKDSAQAATMTKGAFQGLTQKATIDGLQSIGVSLFDAEGKMRDMDAVIREVTPKLQNMSDEEFAALRASIGGPEGLQALFNQLKSSGDDVIGMLDAFDRSEFDIEKALANAKGDFNTLKDIVGRQFNSVMIMLGQQILPTLARGLKVISDFIKDGVAFWNQNTEAIKNWGGFFLEALTAVGIGLAVYNVGIGVAAVKTGYLALKTLWLSKATIFATAKTWLLNSALMANPLGFVIAGLAALAAGVYFAYQRFDWFRDIIDGIWESMKDFGKGVFDFMMTPILELLALIAKIPGMGDIAKGIGKGIVDFRNQLDSQPQKKIEISGTNIVESNTAPTIQEPPKVKAGLKTTDLFGEDSGNEDPEKDPLKDVKTGAESITSGGPKQTNITINIAKLNESINVSTTNLNEGLGEIEDKIMETLLRAVNGANYAAS